MAENPNNDQMYQSIKTTMRAITREENDINIIDAHVKMMQQIMVHTYQFMNYIYWIYMNQI